MKTSNRLQFHRPTVVHAGSLRTVTATISDPAQFSDARLKTDLEPFEKVLPRLKNLK